MAENNSKAERLMRKQGRGYGFVRTQETVFQIVVFLLLA